MGELEPLARAEQHHRVFADHVAAAHRVDTDLASRPRPDLAGTAVGSRCGGAAPAAAAGSLTELERAAIAQALTSVGGNRRRAAELLGIAERTLYDKLKRYGIE